jgi:hypothetical protein
MLQNCTQEKVELKVEGREEDFNLSLFKEGSSIGHIDIWFCLPKKRMILKIRVGGGKLGME